MKRNETIQNYLEAIYFIQLEKGKVRAIDVVKYMKYSRPTVSVALKQLETDGYITIEKNLICLKPEGVKIAKAMSERHEYIAKLLMSLGVSKARAYEDSCLIEHDLSAESFKAIKKATKDKIH